MAVAIDKNSCVGCGRCVAICPGNLIRRDADGKANLKKPEECWNCLSCVKECPCGAIDLSLAPELGGRGGRMSLERTADGINWQVKRADGSSVQIHTGAAEANKY